MIEGKKTVDEAWRTRTPSSSPSSTSKDHGPYVNNRPGRREHLRPVAAQTGVARVGHASWLIPYALLAPGLLVIAALLLYPLYQMVDMSFHDVRLKNLRAINPVPPEFVGLENYTKIFESDLFWPSLRNTLLFAAAAVALTIVLGTLVGLLLHRLGSKMSMFVIVGVMAAWATPPPAQAIIWKWLFDSDAGIANWALNLLPDWLSNLVFGRADWSGQPWLNEPFTIYLVLTVSVVWASFPFIAVSILAGLKSIPHELYEAAEMDGSGPITTFAKITLPMLKPVYAVLIVLSIIWTSRSSPSSISSPAGPRTARRSTSRSGATPRRSVEARRWAWARPSPWY